jgi:ATP-dependent exoDNAse (exonuclease V) alpha subunit
VKLSPKQSSALDAIARWLRDPNGKQTFYLAGAAGSGKSTITKHAVADVEGRVVYCAPTGKAALVMRRKGCVGARTIHQTIYRPAGGDPLSPEAIAQMRENIRLLLATNEPNARATADKIAEQIKRAEDDASRKGPRFSLNLASEVNGAAVCVVDECSMVDRFVGEDLESYGTKLLVIGDPNQLPPVYGAGYFTSREPDAYLDEIHRQALGSPILRLADLARRGERLPYGEIGPGVDVRHKGDPSLEDRALTAEMILVGRNRTRHASNTKIRRLLGRTVDTAPMPGDRVICRRNDHELGLLNGSSWIVDSCVPNIERMTADIAVVSTEDKTDRVECSTWLHHFWGREDELVGFARRDRAEFSYGWAQTVHTAQGSQYDDVLLFDESRQFGKDASKHLYTGITRAAKTLTVVVM